MQKRVFLVLPMLVILNLILIGAAYASQNPTVNRLAGNDRYETAAQIAKDGWQLSVSAVLTYGENYPDALAAVPLAKKLNAPILLTNKDSLNPKTSAVLQDLKVKIVYLIGGTAVIPIEIEKELTNAGYIVKRISGLDKYDTAIKIAEELGDVSEVVITTGDDYADALSIGPIAAEKQIPIILVPKDDITSSIEKYISSRNITKTYVIGDQSIISDNVVNKFSNPERIVGQDKYARNVAILNRFTDTYQHNNICLATGENFADSLAGAAYVSKINGALALVRSDLPDSSRNFLKANASYLTNVTVFGGEAVVPLSVIEGIFIITSNTTESTDLKAYIDGQTYINNYFGFEIAIPDGWNAEDISSEAPSLRMSKNNGIYDYAAFKLEVSEPNPLLNDIKSMKNEDFESYVKSEFDSSMRIIFPKKMYTKVIDDIEFKVVEVDLREKTDPKITLHLKIYFTTLKRYNLQFQMGYLNNTDSGDFAQILSSIKFSDDVKKCEAYYTKGELLFKLGKYQEALDCYVEAAKISPYYVAIIDYRGYSLGINSDFQMALLYYNKYIENSPENWRGYFQKGVCLQYLERYEEALDCYNAADKYNPNKLSILSNKGEVLAILGRTEEANKCFNEAVKIEPENAYDYRGKGNLFLDLNRFEEAIVCFDKSIEIDPYDPRTFNDKGIALHSLGKYEEAIAYYDIAIKLDPNYALPYTNKSKALIKLGRNKEAIECMEKYNSLTSSGETEVLQP